MGRKLFALDDPVGREGKLQLSTFAHNNLIGYAQMSTNKYLYRTID